MVGIGLDASDRCARKTKMFFKRMLCIYPTVDNLQMFSVKENSDNEVTFTPVLFRRKCKQCELVFRGNRRTTLGAIYNNAIHFYQRID